MVFTRVLTWDAYWRASPRDAAPKLAAYANSSPSHLVNGIKAAKAVEVAKDDESD